MFHPNLFLTWFPSQGVLKFLNKVCIIWTQIRHRDFSELIKVQVWAITTEDSFLFLPVLLKKGRWVSMVWLRGFYIHPKGRCSGRGSRTFWPLGDFAGVTVLLLFKNAGFKTQTPEYSLGFKDCERAIISRDLKKIPGFWFSDFEGPLLPHNYSFYDLAVCLSSVYFNL